MDKLGLGDSLLRTQLEKQLQEEEQRRAKKQQEQGEKQRQLSELEAKAAEADKLLAALAVEGDAAAARPAAEAAAPN